MHKICSSAASASRCGMQWDLVYKELMYKNLHEFNKNNTINGYDTGIKGVCGAY
jgi:hypothetical protein